MGKSPGVVGKEVKEEREVEEVKKVREVELK
jgi:hypothetical protein